jgi:TonB family protein
MKEFTFATGSAPTLPTHGRSTTLVTVLLHLILFGMLINLKTHPVRLSPAGTQTGIAAYVPGWVGTAGASEAKPAVEPKKTTIARTAKTALKEEQSDAAQSATGPGTPGGQAGGGPVRLGTGEGPTLMNKVMPVYPAIMQSARVPGQVVLDAIIHRDGTIGDLTVLRSTNGAFAQAAIIAVKQWRYTPIPYEGILTVTVNFTLAR